MMRYDGEEGGGVSLRERAALDVEEGRRLNPLRMAYMGDTVWEMLVRARLIEKGFTVRHMHQMAVAGVNAAAQAAALERMEPVLSEEEKGIVLRGRNAHSRHHAPKHQRAVDYQSATALEALFGYLYLTGQEERLLELFRVSQEEAEACQAST